MVHEIVRRARRRVLANEMVRQSTYALSAALLSLILLLLCGTQILNWIWLLGLPAVALAAGAYWTWRRWPSPYQVAQRVDRALEIPDTLSTALFFAASNRRASADIRRAQWSQAEHLARTLDVRRAVPIRAPRALYGTALLGLIASSLFALRYGLDHRLNLRPPLPSLVQAKLGQRPDPQTVRAGQHQPPPQPDRHPDRGKEASPSADSGQAKSPGELDAAPDSVLDTVNVPDVDGQNGSARAQAEGRQSADGEGKSGQPGEHSSLMGKLRDAMSSLLSRMRPQPDASQPGQPTGTQSGPQTKNDPGSGSQQGKQGGQRGEGQRGGAQDGQPSDESQDAQGGQSRSAGQSGPEPSTKQPGSGIGSQDGNKDVKLAAQLAAMGKISEIIGKRSANVTGEVTVEVQNANQQLRTPYAQRAARHAQAGGEISRDEVPVALQDYVQQYFEELRKTARPVTSATPAVAPQRPGPSPGHRDSK